MDVSVEIHCAKCGSANYSLSEGRAELGMIACNDCGRTMGSLEALKSEMLDQAIARSSERLREALDLAGRPPSASEAA